MVETSKGNGETGNGETGNRRINLKEVRKNEGYCFFNAQGAFAGTWFAGNVG